MATVINVDGLDNRQLALVLAVEAHGDKAAGSPSSVERTADKYLRYLDTGVMG